MPGKSGVQCAENERTVQYNAARVSFHPDGTQEDLKLQFRELAREIVSGLSMLESAQSKELLGSFVSDLFFSAAEQERREFCRRKQAEGIAAAKAQGVRLGRARKPLPDKFSECYEAWRDGQMTITKAAEACGLSRDTFRRAIARVEEAEDFV